MVKEQIVGCRTLERELMAAAAAVGNTDPILWIPSGLHASPPKLTARLQEVLDGVEEDCDRVLMAMGYCGNAVLGLRNGPFELVIPKVDDCITLVLGSTRRRQEISAEEGTYFMTKGWLDGEQNLWMEYEYARNKYGEEMAQEIYQDLLRHYSRLALIDTGVYPIAPTAVETERIAREFHLSHQIMPGTLDYLKKLLQGPWSDEEFLIIQPGRTIGIEDIF